MTDILKFEEQLISEVSKANVNYICHYLGNDETSYQLLWEIIKKEEPRISLMAVWVWDNITMKYEYLFLAYLTEVINHLHNFKLDSTKRIILRILSRYPIPISHQGKLFELCSKYVMNPKDALAVKIHSLQILYNICKEQPELKFELIDIIEFQYDINTVGFKSRANKLLKKLNKELVARK